MFTNGGSAVIGRAKNTLAGSVPKGPLKIFRPELDIETDKVNPSTKSIKTTLAKGDQTKDKMSAEEISGGEGSSDDLSNNDDNTSFDSVGSLASISTALGNTQVISDDEKDSSIIQSVQTHAFEENVNVNTTTVPDVKENHESMTESVDINKHGERSEDPQDVSKKILPSSHVEKFQNQSEELAIEVNVLEEGIDKKALKQRQNRKQADRASARARAREKERRNLRIANGEELDEKFELEEVDSTLVVLNTVDPTAKSTTGTKMMQTHLDHNLRKKDTQEERILTSSTTARTQDRIEDLEKSTLLKEDLSGEQQFEKSNESHSQSDSFEETDTGSDDSAMVTTDILQNKLYSVLLLFVAFDVH